MMNRAVKLYDLNNGKGKVTQLQSLCLSSYLYIIPCLSVKIFVTSLGRASSRKPFKWMISCGIKRDGFQNRSSDFKNWRLMDV